MLGEQIRVAGTSLSRLVGLLGKRGLEPGTGLLIIPSQAIHTVAMRFAIDVVFVDRDWRVIHLRPTMVPFRVTGLHWKARSVLELPWVLSLRPRPRSATNCPSTTKPSEHCA